MVYGPDEFWALGVKHARKVRSRDLRHLRTFKKDYPEARVRLAYGGEERLKSRGVVCLPFRELLAEIVPSRPLP